jgi:hypothetical protein
MDETYGGGLNEAEAMQSTGSGAYPVDKMAYGLRNPPVRKILEHRIAELEKQIEAHRNALAALDANKGVEQVLDTLRKLGI